MPQTRNSAGNGAKNTPRRDAAPLVNGFLNFYKPVGLTSMAALRQIKRITGQRQKVGHCGTMDPLAQGVLPVCFGQATRLMDYVVDGTKRYRMKVRLGATSITYDAEGEITETGDPSQLTAALVEQTLQPFIGAIEQTPPMYSAVKIKGQRLYRLARAGVEVERAARPVEILDIRLVDFSLPELTLDVECGRGVYMRSLAHDLGAALGCGGYVIDLVRQYCGTFHAADGSTLESLAAANAAEPGGWQSCLHPIDRVLRDLRAITISPQAEQNLRHGQAISPGRAVPEAGYLEQFRVYARDGRFLALVKYDRPANSWQPVKVFQLEAPSPFASDAIPS